ncbi:unnamed protein product, partial [Laminaria digitata]
MTPGHGGVEYMTPGRGGQPTPLSSACPSPLRSCPRAAVSAKKERLNERHARAARVDELSPAAAAVVVLKDPPDICLWASSKVLRSPAIMGDIKLPPQNQKQ